MQPHGSPPKMRLDEQTPPISDWAACAAQRTVSSQLCLLPDDISCWTSRSPKHWNMGHVLELRKSRDATGHLDGVYTSSICRATVAPCWAWGAWPLGRSGRPRTWGSRTESTPSQSLSTLSGASWGLIIGSQGPTPTPRRPARGLWLASRAGCRKCACRSMVGPGDHSPGVPAAACSSLRGGLDGEEFSLWSSVWL